MPRAGAFAVCLIAGLTACADDASDPVGTEPAISTDETRPTVTPTSDAGDEPTPADPTPADSMPTTSFPTTVYEPGTIDPGLAPFVDRAAADLGERLGIDPSAIETLTAVLVVWPDASLGCADPDLSYAQVATDGSVIELGVDGAVYRYHSGGTREPFLCGRPLDRPPPAIPAP